MLTRILLNLTHLDFEAGSWCFKPQSDCDHFTSATFATPAKVSSTNESEGESYGPMAYLIRSKEEVHWIITEMIKPSL